MSHLSHTNKRIHSGFLLLGTCALLFSQAVLSDATLVYEQISGTQKAINSMQIKEGKIRFTPPNQDSNFSLYNSETSELTHIDVTQKKYLVMTEKDIEIQAAQAKKQMDMMRQRMMERMKDMPPEQKKQVEQMMSNHLAQVDAQKTQPKVEQKKTSQTETISGLQCTVHETYINGMKNSELCIAEPDDMKLSSEDAQALMAMQAFMKRMQKVAQSMMESSASNADIQGIPLHTKLFAPDGSVKLETRLSSISTNTLDSKTVTIPADFSQMKMPAMPGMK